MVLESSRKGGLIAENFSASLYFGYFGAKMPFNIAGSPKSRKAKFYDLRK